MASGNMASEPLDEVLWRAPEWIQMFGLRTDNVLEYFSQSPFYDRSSNNQVLKMQSQFNENLHGHPDLSAELKNMQGIEFVVALAREPDMWVIRKQNRMSPHEAKQLATYFVVRENIFMAPSVYSVVSSRLLSTVLSLNKALDKAVSLPTYSPSQGYSYIDDTSSLTTDDTATASSTPKTSSTAKNGSKSSYPSPMPSSASSSQTPGASQNINNNIPIPSVDDRLSNLYMDRALTYSMSNSTVYLDNTELGSAAIVPTSEIQSKPTPSTAGTPQNRRLPAPRKAK